MIQSSDIIADQLGRCPLCQAAASLAVLETRMR